MTPNRLSDLVAVCSGHPEHLEVLDARMPRGPGWRPLGGLPSTWRASTRSLGHGEVPDSPPLVLEGWPDLLRWRGDLIRASSDLLDGVHARRWDVASGDVSYVHLGEGEATIVRAPASRVPVYVHRTSTSLLVTSRMDLMLALRPEWPWQIDGAATLFAVSIGLCPDGRTPVQDIDLVPAGHVLEISLTGPRRGRRARYWDPRPAEAASPVGEREYAYRLRELLMEHLEIELDPRGTNLLGLSLGVDSSTLAVATGQLGRGYAAVSYLPTNVTDRRAADELIAMVHATAPPSKHIKRHIDDEKWLESLRSAVPNGLPVLHSALIDMPMLRGEIGATALYGGEWGDAICGDRITVGDWLAEAPIWRLLAHQASVPTGEKAVLAAIGRRAVRALPLPAQVGLEPPADQLVNVSLHAELVELTEVLRRSSSQEPWRRLRLWFETQLEFWMLQNWEVLSGLDVRRVAPFYQRRLIELALKTPPHYRIGPGVKKPLRTAFTGVVPDRLLVRPKDLWPNEPASQAKPWGRDLPEELSAFVREEWLPRPPGCLTFGDRLTLSLLESFALRLRAVRSATSNQEPHS